MGETVGTAEGCTSTVSLAILRALSKITFASWLNLNRDRKDAVGRLADHVGTRLPHVEDRKALRKAVSDTGAPKTVLQDFDVAWRIYRS